MWLSGVSSRVRRDFHVAFVISTRTQKYLPPLSFKVTYFVFIKYNITECIIQSLNEPILTVTYTYHIIFTPTRHIIHDLKNIIFFPNIPNAISKPVHIVH